MIWDRSRMEKAKSLSLGMVYIDKTGELSGSGGVRTASLFINVSQKQCPGNRERKCFGRICLRGLINRRVCVSID
jgi:hypothetical protein